jgi:hypothetical protein
VPRAPDFYRADFGGFALPTAMMGLGLICLWRGFFVAAAAVISGLLLYGLDLHESANLWDCLIDFPSVVVSVVILVKGAIQRHHRPSFGDVQAGGGGYEVALEGAGVDREAEPFSLGGGPYPLLLEWRGWVKSHWQSGDNVPLPRVGSARLVVSGRSQ